MADEHELLDDPGPPTDPAAAGVAEVVADHASIDRLVEELLPALIAKLGATGLGEIEIREGPWRVRVRRPAGDSSSLDSESLPGRRATDRPSRPQPGHAGHGHAPGAVESHRSARETRPSGNGHRTSLVAVGPGSDDRIDGLPDEGRSRDRRRTIATSPAVGLYRPMADVRPGSRVRAGDPLGIVDVLGIPQEVSAPTDGIVGASLVEAGEAVEYGQELVVIEFSGAGSTGAPPPEAGES
jgi:biotin carboxyl carrier protein